MRRFLLFLFTLTFFSCGGDESKEEPIEIVEPDPIIILTVKLEGGIDYVDFGEIVKSNNKSIRVTIANEGDTTLKIDGVSLSEGFSSSWTSTSIAPNVSKDLEITFSPSEEKEYIGNLQFTSNATKNSTHITVKGVGVSDVFEGDVNVLSQEELEDFSSRGYKSINGKLSIGSAFGTNGYAFPYEITDLTPLNTITSVKSLDIIHTTLTSIEGLENIDVTTFIQIAFNKTLKTLKGFPQKRDTGIGLNLNGNEELESINDLLHIKSFAWLRIASNINLENLEGLNNVTEVGGDLSIEGNLRIENLNELTNLKLVGEDLSIRDNQALYSFCGLLPLVTDGEIKGTFYLMNRNRFNPGSIKFECERLVPLNEYHGVQTWISGDYWLDFFKEKKFTKISGEIYIKGDQIKDLSALNAVEEFNGTVYIEETALTSLEGLNNIKKIKSSINLKNNQMLSNYCALNNLIQTQTTDYTIRTESNLYNPTKTDLINGNCSQ